MYACTSSLAGPQAIFSLNTSQLEPVSALHHCKMVCDRLLDETRTFSPALLPLIEPSPLNSLRVEPCQIPLLHCEENDVMLFPPSELQLFLTSNTAAVPCVNRRGKTCVPCHYPHTKTINASREEERACWQRRSADVDLSPRQMER